MRPVNCVLDDHHSTMELSQFLPLAVSQLVLPHPPVTDKIVMDITRHPRVFRIYLHHAHLRLNPFLPLPDEILHCLRHQTKLHPTTEQCVCFATARLPIRHQRTIVAGDCLCDCGQHGLREHDIIVILRAMQLVEADGGVVDGDVVVVDPHFLVRRPIRWFDACVYLDGGGRLRLLPLSQ